MAKIKATKRIEYDEPRYGINELDELCLDCCDFLHHSDCDFCSVNRLKERIRKHTCISATAKEEK